MNRKQSKELLPIIQAFAEGKTVEYQNAHREWIEVKNPAFSEHYTEYRIKPESKYRPFANANECFEEMKKHQPFGWIKASHGQFLMTGLRNDTASFGISDNWHGYNYIFESYTFADGKPFGIVED